MAKVRKIKRLKRERVLDDFDVRHKIDTLLQAEEIKADKPLMNLLNSDIEKRQKALNKIQKRK